MEESLLTSLKSFGVSTPPGDTSIQSLTPDSLFSIWSQSLSIVDSSSSLPKSLPKSTADRVKVWLDLIDKAKDHGYHGNITVNRFLCEEDYVSLMRNSIEKLFDKEAGVTEGDKCYVKDTSEHLKPKVELFYHSNTKGDETVGGDFQENVNSNEENIKDPLDVSKVNPYEKVESSSFTKTCFVLGNHQTKEIFSEADALKDLDPCQSEEEPELSETIK